MAGAKDRVDNIEDFDLDPVVGEDETIIEAEPVSEVFGGQESTAVAKVSKEVTSTDDFDFSGLEGQIGVVVGDMGMTVSRLPVERTRFTTSSKSLISIVTDKVVAVKVHYREGLGSYLCTGGLCCKLDGLARIKYLFPVVVYDDTDKSGKPLSKKVSCKVLAVGKDSYEDLTTLAEMQGSLSSLDLVVTCKDEQYQKISFTPAGQARWKHSKELVAQVREFWKEHIKDLVAPIARTVTEADLRKEMEDVQEPQTVGSDVNFDDVFKD